MKKLRAVFKREYLQAVRKKSFLIMTVLTPFLFAGLMVFPSLLAVKGLGEKSVVVVDGTGRLEAAVSEGLRSLEPPDLGGVSARSLERRDRKHVRTRLDPGERGPPGDSDLCRFHGRRSKPCGRSTDRAG